MSDLAGFVDELTDWHNLMQGAFGSLLAVFGAFAAALWTVRRQLAADRRHAHERHGQAAAQRLQPELNGLGDALLGLRIPAGPDDDEASLAGFPRQARAAIGGPSDAFRQRLQQVDPELPEEIAGRLRLLSRMAVSFARNPGPPQFWRDTLERLSYGVVEADGMLSRYRRDAVSEVKRLHRIDRLRRWRRQLPAGLPADQ